MVRLIDADGSQVGIVSNAEAMEKADEAGMDLVMMADGETPVCKIMDYGKHIFEAKKQKAAQKKSKSRRAVEKKLNAHFTVPPTPPKSVHRKWLFHSILYNLSLIHI